MGDNNNNSTVIFNSSGPGGSQYYYDQSAKFNPTTAVVIISLIGGCFVLAFVSVVLRKCIRGDSGLTGSQSSATQQSGSYNNMKAKGLAKTDVDALPLVHRADLDEKLLDARECPVCLTDFEPEDPLRLLPTCKHVFHQECIDAWFDAHSTCPLCRASLLGGEMETTKPQPAVGGHGDPVETITEVSESGHNSDMETRPPPNTLDAPLDTYSRMAAQVSREESESFKREPQPSSTKNIINSSFRKPSIRRSSSLSADLIALRNLLMHQNDNNASDGPSRRWFTRARSLDLARPRQDSRDREEWVTIDLETGKAAQIPSSSSSISKGESSKAPERAWSDRWSLATLKGAVLTRSTSDVYSRSAHLPI